jgi:hypothetical protein
LVIALGAGDTVAAGDEVAGKRPILGLFCRFDAFIQVVEGCAWPVQVEADPTHEPGEPRGSLEKANAMVVWLRQLKGAGDGLVVVADAGADLGGS